MQHLLLPLLFTLLVACGGKSDDNCDEKLYIIHDTETGEDFFHVECREEKSCKITFCKGDDCPRICPK